MNPITPPTTAMSWEQVTVWCVFFITQAITAWFTYKAHQQQVINHSLMNSRFDELVESKEAAANARGRAAATEEARVRAVDLMAKDRADVKADAVEKLTDRHGNGPDERLNEIRGES